MHARTLLRPAPLAATLLSLILAGCSGRTDLSTRPSVAGDPTLASKKVAAAASATQPGFYPLTVGNRWTYHQEYVAQLVPNEGEAPPPERIESNYVRSITEGFELDGREYLVEQEVGEGAYLGVVMMRQNTTGLYEWSPIALPAPATGRAAADSKASAVVALRIPIPAGRSSADRAAYEMAARRLEARAALLRTATARGPAALAGIRPRGVQPWELTRLRYPLAPKARWAIAAAPPFQLQAEVIGAETLQLPPGNLRGYRIRLRPEFLGPTDNVYVWYGPSGFLQLTAHLEVDAVDQSSAVIGRYVLDQREWLTELALVGSSPLADVPFGPPRPRK
jgi:hypothetical protein